MGIIFIIGTFQAFFLEFILLNKKRKSLSDKILAIWMFFIGIHLFSYYLIYADVINNYPHLIGVTVPFPLLHSPFLFLYVQLNIRRERFFKWFDYLHFIPAFLVYTYMFKVFFLLPGNEKIEFVASLEKSLPYFQIFIMFSIIISGIVYISYSLILLRKHKKLISDNFSYNEKINLSWLRNLIFGMAGIWIVIILMNTLTKALDVNITFDNDIFIFSAVTIFVLILGFYGIKQVGVFSDPQLAKDVTSNSSSQLTESQYLKSGLKHEQAIVYNETLLSLMSEKQPYLEPKLSLSQLARHIKIKPNHLSQIINQYQQTNFYDFVNQFRIDEFKTRIKDPKNKHLNILAIAYDCGFNSKSSFNNVFKKLTGNTPSKFINSLTISN